MIALLRVAAGLALLTLGRKLFWLALAALGFVAGMSLARDWLPGQSEGTALVIGLVAGAVGALLAVALQKVAIGVAGLAAGGYLAFGFTQLIGGEPSVVIVVVGAVLGLILIYPLFDWGLILLSSLSGALILVQTLEAGRVVSAVLFVAALAFGLTVQGMLLRRRPKPPPKPQSPEGQASKS